VSIALALAAGRVAFILIKKLIQTARISLMRSRRSHRKLGALFVAMFVLLPKSAVKLIGWGEEDRFY